MCLFVRVRFLSKSTPLMTSHPIPSYPIHLHPSPHSSIRVIIFIILVPGRTCPTASTTHNILP